MKSTSLTKRILLPVTALLLCVQANAQKPETVYGNARIEKPTSWYQEQSAAWKKEVEKNPKDGNAWYNYYYANRVLAYRPDDTRKMEEKQAAIDKLIEDMGKSIPNSYEYNLCKWAAGGFDLSLLPYLKRANELGPDRTEHIDFMINIGEMERNVKERDKYCLRKFETNNVSTGMLYYNYNVLMGLAPNAILITCGDNDTYPVWVLQAQGVRKDVTVINLSLIMVDEYRKKLFSELGIDPLESSKSRDPKLIDEHYAHYREKLINHLSHNKKNYPIYLALTTANDTYHDTIQQNLYLTGLAYQYNKDPMDNMALLRRNFEQNYALDYIDKSFYTDISADKVKMINMNYLVPMLKLYEHYQAAGESQKKEWIRLKIEAISKGTEYEAEVKKHIH